MNINRKRIIELTALLAITSAISMASFMTGKAAEQQVLWRQIKIGTYSVTWPAAQGGASTCLTNDGAGALTWGSCGGGTQVWTQGTGVLTETTLANHVQIGGAATTSALRFMEQSANGVNFVGFQAPTNILADKIWTLPAADGTNGYVLSTNGAGVLSWILNGSGTHPDPHRLSDGTITAPVYSWSGHTTSGIFWDGNGPALKENTRSVFRLNGSYGESYFYFDNLNNDWTTFLIRKNVGTTPTQAALKVDASQLLMINSGTTAAPTYSFSGSTTDGIYKATDGVAMVSNTGELVLSRNYSAFYLYINNKGNYDPYLLARKNTTTASATASLYLDATNLVMVNGGSKTAPAVTFNGSTNTGVYNATGGVGLTSQAGMIEMSRNFGQLIVDLVEKDNTSSPAIASWNNDNTSRTSTGLYLNASWVSTTTEYRVNGTKVVGSQQAAVANATDNASAITQLNALLARLRTHGLIAP